MRKPVFAMYKGADQPGHPHSLNSTFVIRCLDSTIPEVNANELGRLADLILKEKDRKQ